jgi:hypothetical protein
MFIDQGHRVFCKGLVITIQMIHHLHFVLAWRLIRQDQTRTQEHSVRACNNQCGEYQERFRSECWHDSLLGLKQWMNTPSVRGSSLFDAIVHQIKVETKGKNDRSHFREFLKIDEKLKKDHMVGLIGQAGQGRIDDL